MIRVARSKKMKKAKFSHNQFQKGQFLKNEKKLRIIGNIFRRLARKICISIKEKAKVLIDQHSTAVVPNRGAANFWNYLIFKYVFETS